MRDSEIKNMTNKLFTLVSLFTINKLIIGKIIILPLSKYIEISVHCVLTAITYTNGKIKHKFGVLLGKMPNLRHPFGKYLLKILNKAYTSTDSK